MDIGGEFLFRPRYKKFTTVHPLSMPACLPASVLGSFFCLPAVRLFDPPKWQKEIPIRTRGSLLGVKGGGLMLPNVQQATS